MTTRELAYLIRKAGIDFASLPDGERDSLMGESTGGATIFGVTGGVMEAALRFAYQAVTGIRPDSWDFKQVRGLSGLKEYTVTLNGTELRLAVVHGAKRFAEICDQVKAGELACTISSNSWLAPGMRLRRRTAAYAVPVRLA